MEKSFTYSKFTVSEPSYEEKNIYELITDTSNFTQEEIEKMYQPKGELKRILEIVSEVPNVEEVEINDKVLIVRK